MGGKVALDCFTALATRVSQIPFRLPPLPVAR
jgi:hypothetical protein